MNLADTKKDSNAKHENATTRPTGQKSLDGITNFHPEINRPAESGGQTQGGGGTGQTAPGGSSGSGSGSA